ncbi:hypothetical protein [Chondrinema litorale]|uniref:hypothetical protein n=1 Tax=Chondrinema litorale TaxID=2994555 RepID=UPI002543C138|nr:hypothetical protein [Chondrinema litorale]UZR99739.1 hypothetical protein OQ292_37685 [Chondrinema litorale]
MEQLPDSKTAVYWVSSNIKNYLLLFHQKGQLVLEVAYPCYDDVKDKGLAKLKEINTSMNINSKMLANATVEGLSVNQKPVSFWKDPYKGIYSTGIVPIVPVLRLKIRNTPFENGTIGEARAKGGDDYYFYKGDKGQVWFTTKLEDTELTSEAYFSEDKSPVFYEYKYLSETRKVYITQKEENGNVIGKAETYYRDNRTLHFEYEYPVGDTQAEKYLKDMFEHIRISAFL